MVAPPRRLLQPLFRPAQAGVISWLSAARAGNTDQTIAVGSAVTVVAAAAVFGQLGCLVLFDQHG